MQHAVRASIEGKADVPWTSPIDVNDPIQTSRRVSNKLQFARSPHRVTPGSCDILWV
jgi:hypothetical protein